MANTMTEQEAMEAAAAALIQLKNSPGWQILMAQLRHDAEEAKDSLVTIAPTEADQIRELQNEVYRLYWIEESVEALIQDGIGSEIVTDIEEEAYE